MAAMNGLSLPPGLSPWRRRRAGGQLPGVERGQQFLPGGFGGGVVADLVQQVAGEFLGAGADGAAAAAGDERHQRGEVPGAAGEQVVRQVVGDHARVRAGEHEVLLDGQQQLPPGRAGPSSVTISNGLTPRVVQRRAFWASSSSPAARPSRTRPRRSRPDADEQERDREGVGQVLEVVGDVAAVAAARVQEVHVVDHAEPDITGENRVGGLVAEFLGVALVVAGQAEEPAEHRVERPLARR